MRTWIVWLVVLLGSVGVASAPVFPADADVFLTIDRGTIVGVGKVVAGGALELRVLQGFSGPARLTIVSPGHVAVFDVVVRGPGGLLPFGDVVLDDGTSLFASLPGGAEASLAWSEAPADGLRAPGIEGSNASDTGRENANPRASEGGNPRSDEENPGRKP